VDAEDEIMKPTVKIGLISTGFFIMVSYGRNRGTRFRWSLKACDLMITGQ